MSLEKMREEFEVFALSLEGGLSAGHIVKGEDGEYFNFAAQCYWDFWRGSRAALEPEIERLQRFETAYKEFSDKTDWVRPNAAAQELGMHVADVIRKRCDDMTSHNKAQSEEIVRLRKDAGRLDWLGGTFGGIDIVRDQIDAAMALEQQP